MSTSLFTEAQERQLADRGISAAEAQRQIGLMRNESQFARLQRPATIDDGIRHLNPREEAQFLELGNDAARAGRLSKFIPASGAATRMFQQFSGLDHDPRTVDGQGGAEWFTKHAAKLPFGEEQADAATIRELLYGLDGLAARPKGLVPFHRYGVEARTAAEEHMLEAARTCCGDDGVARLHFTIPESSRAMFEAAVDRIRPLLQERFGVRAEVTFSVQDPSTDTVACTPEGLPFIDGDGRLVLRPGGHGALLRNLERCGGDLVVIRNIDNVVVERDLDLVVRWNLILSGLLSDLEDRSSVLLALMVHCGTSNILAHIETFLERELGFRPDENGSIESRKHAAIAILNRPWRVCGMVRNDGEPGGGPFWIAGDGAPALQIIESAQVDLNDFSQARAWRGATHFNPVHLVCGLRDRDGSPFRLADFADPAQSFIIRKTHQGKPLVAMEHPGLWNGAMARWNTIFVEVPSATFAPVKTVADLLRHAHQAVAA
ncbi:MAG TPA: DUF4301 family protein [Thermoanaerobaculia bacterium]|nr:DUF4301 family protein [Thermoanaerobaculia bacterium]